MVVEGPESAIYDRHIPHRIGDTLSCRRRGKSFEMELVLVLIDSTGNYSAKSIVERNP